MSANLHEMEIIGLQVVCAMRCGLLGAFSCNECSLELQEERNCNGLDSDKSVLYLDGIGEFYACPIKFIPESVYSFIEMYDYYEKYPNSAPSFDDVNPRYLQALKLYESTTREMSSPKEKPKKDVHKSNISKMRSLMK